jgi:hypothetical protein
VPQAQFHPFPDLHHQALAHLDRRDRRHWGHQVEKAIDIVHATTQDLMVERAGQHLETQKDLSARMDPPRDQTDRWVPSGHNYPARRVASMAHPDSASPSDQTEESNIHLQGLMDFRY